MKATEPDEFLTAIETALEMASADQLAAPERIRALGEAASSADAYFVHASQQPPSTPKSERVVALLNQASSVLSDVLLPAVAEEGIHLLSVNQLEADQRTWLQTAYRQQIFPLLIPLAVDPGRPFPHLRNGGLNLLAVLRDQTEEPALENPAFALVEVPDALNRWLKIESDVSGKEGQTSWIASAKYGPGTYLWAEEVVQSYIEMLFPGMVIEYSHFFRVLDAKASSNGKAVTFPASDTRTTQQIARLDVDEAMPLPVRRWLTHHLHAPTHILIRSHPPMAMADLVGIAERLPKRRRWIMNWLHRLWRTILRK